MHCFSHARHGWYISIWPTLVGAGKTWMLNAVQVFFVTLSRQIIRYPGAPETQGPFSKSWARILCDIGIHPWLFSTSGVSEQDRYNHSAFHIWIRNLGPGFIELPRLSTLVCMTEPHLSRRYVQTSVIGWSPFFLRYTGLYRLHNGSYWHTLTML